MGSGKVRTASREMRMEFTPMIDVVFLLLIFFMCTLRFKPLQGKLATYLPAVHGSARIPEVLAPVERIRIKLSQRGSSCVAFVNGRAVGILPAAREALYRRIRALKQASPRSPAEIDPDPQVAHKDVVAVVDACLRAHVTDIAFTVVRPGGTRPREESARGG